MKTLAGLMIVAFLMVPAFACADKGDHDKKQSQKHEQKHEKKKVPKVVEETALASVPVGAAVIWAAPALGFFASAAAAMLIYDVYYADYPPAFKGQQWDSCANAKFGSGMEQACKHAGFLP